MGTLHKKVASCKFGQTLVLCGQQHHVERVRLSQKFKALTKLTHGISCRNARASQRCEYCQYLNNFISDVLGPPDLGLIEKQAYNFFLFSAYWTRMRYCNSNDVLLLLFSFLHASTMGLSIYLPICRLACRYTRPECTLVQNILTHKKITFFVKLGSD